MKRESIRVFALGVLDCLALLVGGLLWSVGRSSAGEGTVVVSMGTEQSRAPVEHEAEGDLFAEVAVDEKGFTRLAPGTAGELPVAVADADVVPPPDPPVVRILGQFLLPDGSPAAGAAWFLGAERETGRGRLDHLAPLEWTDLDGALDEEGRLDESFALPGADTYIDLVVTAHLCLFFNESFARLSPGDVLDMGTRQFVQGGRVEGIVIDRTGKVLEGRGLAVRAESASRHGFFGHSHWLDPETGIFEIDGLPAGDYLLRLDEQRIVHHEGPTITIVPGQSTEAQVMIDGSGPLEGALAVAVRTRPPGQEHVLDPGSVRLIGPGGGVLLATRQESRVHWFEGLMPGEHQVVVDDAAFLPWKQRGVQPGDMVQAHLEGSASLLLDVRDEAGGEVDLYTVDVAAFDRHGRRVTTRYHEGRVSLPGGRLAGIVPGREFSITIGTTEGRAHSQVESLNPGEERLFSLTLADTLLVRGSVHYRDGSPAAGVTVRLVEPAKVEDSPGSRVLGPGSSVTPDRFRRELERTVADGAGAFRLQPRAVGDVLVLAGKEEGPNGESPVLSLRSGTVVEGLRIELPRSGRLLGQVTAPSGVELAGWTILCGPNGPTPSLSFGTSFLVDVEGRFVAGPLPPGSHEVFLLSPTEAESPMYSMGKPLRGVSLGAVVIPEGADIERVFAFEGPFPVHVSFRVQVRGAEAEPEYVSLRTVAQAGIRTMGFEVEADGETEARLVRPGTYHVEVRGGSWHYRRPEVLEVGGEDLEIPLEFEIRRRRVWLTREGVPLPGEWVRLVFETDDRMGSVHELDAQGSTEWELGAGRYRVGLIASQTARLEADSPTATFLWPLDSAEGTLELR